MPLVAGADACPAGWIRVTLDTETGSFAHGVFATAAGLLAATPKPAAMAVDVPIGLPDAGVRACDVLARRVLGRPRASSVFPAPIRGILRAEDRAHASRLHAAIDGRRVGAQAWGIVPKVAAFDEAFSVEAQAWCVETHPELCFRAWDGERAMAHSKKTAAGRAERRRLVDATFGAPARHTVRAAYPVAAVGHDDLFDAFAALWTARRIAAGRASRVPSDPVPRDARGLRMEIWC